ncbi:MAG: AAA family ATPase [Firmicutes bacterium]|nr:AAA family ATPase [Bacillota bacterium]
MSNKKVSYENLFELEQVDVLADFTDLVLENVDTKNAQKNGEAEASEQKDAVAQKETEKSDTPKNNFITRLAAKSDNVTEIGDITLEFGEVAKLLRKKAIEDGGTLAEVIEKGKVPIGTVRGIKRLVELAKTGNDTDKNTFKKQLEGLASIPWSTFSPTFSDFAKLEKMANEKVMYNKAAIKKFVRAFRAGLEGSSLSGNVIALVGPAKSGKTTLINTILKEIADQYVHTFDCAGVSDIFELGGSSYIYTNGTPSQIVNFMVEGGVVNPYVVFDNVDKFSDNRGTPSTLVAKWLNKDVNHKFLETFLNVPIDLSTINFIVTAESVENIPSGIKNQAIVIEMGNYELDEKVDIALEHIVKKHIAENDVSEDAIKFDRDALVLVINEKAFEPGLAELIKITEDIVSKAAERIHEGEVDTLHITKEYVENYFDENNAKEILRLTDSKHESFRRLASVASNYCRKELTKILEWTKKFEYFLPPAEEKRADLLSRYPRGLFKEQELNYKDVEKLAGEYYGAEESKNQLLTVVAKNMLTGKQDGIVLGLIGNPGVGKTNFAQHTAKMLGLPYVAISMANITDPTEISGVKDKKIGKIADAFITAGYERFVLLVDELDKASVSVQNTWLKILDPIQNTDFIDEYLDIKIPVQNVVIIATINDTDSLSWPVYDRLDKIWMDDYTPKDKVEIAKRGAIEKYTAEAGLAENSVMFSDEILNYIAKRYGVGFGFRRMEKMLQRIIGGCAREILSKGLDKVKYKKKITKKDVFQFLGEPLIRERIITTIDKVGVVKGLASGSFYGSVLPIEASVYPGGGEYELTGSLGEVMRESAKVARAAVRKYLSDKGSDVELGRLGIHVHAEEGAVKKDGPSAGCAIAIALYSAITNTKISGEIALSGEINLQGEVLAVGGLESKLTGAYESGIKTVLLSKDNRQDVEQINNEDIKKLNIIYVKTFPQALDIMTKGKAGKEASKAAGKTTANKALDKKAADSTTTDKKPIKPPTVKKL